MAFTGDEQRGRTRLICLVGHGKAHLVVMGQKHVPF